MSGAVLQCRSARQVDVWMCSAFDRDQVRIDTHLTYSIAGLAESNLPLLHPMHLSAPSTPFPLVFFLYALLLCTFTQSTSWTTFRGNRQHQGVISGSGSTTTQPFEYHTGNYVTSSPTLSSDGRTMYVGSLDEHLHAIDTRTGQMIWKYKTGGSINSSPALSPDGQFVYVGSNDHFLHAVSAATGKKKWAYETGNWVWSSPTVSSDGAAVFVGSLDQKMHCVNDHDGSKNFTYDTADQIWSSPVLSLNENVLYWGSNDKYVHATDLWTIHFKQEGGERQKRFYKWKYLTDGGIYSSPCLGPEGKVLYVGSFDKYLHAITTADGLGHWKFLTQGEIYSSPTVSPDGLTVYICSKDTYIYAVNAVDGTQKWKFKTNGPIVSSPALSADGRTLYVGSSDSIIYVLNTAGGSQKWVYHTLTGYFVDSSPAVRQNWIYVGSSDSAVYAIQDLDWRGSGTLDQSVLGSEACLENCVIKKVRAAPHNLTLWLLQNSGGTRSSVGSGGVWFLMGGLILWCRTRW